MLTNWLEYDLVINIVKIVGMLPIGFNKNKSKGILIV